MKRIALITCLSSLAAISGCKVGPNYRPPGADVADTWLDDKNPAITAVSERLGRRKKQADASPVTPPAAPAVSASA